MRLICGRFEGIDERVIEARAIEELSLGDFVLSGGEPAAIALIDACVRLLPGVVGDAAALGRGELCRRDCSNIPTTPGRRCGRAARCRRCCSRATIGDPRVAAGRGGAADARAAPRFVGTLSGRAAAMPWDAAAIGIERSSDEPSAELEAGAGRKAGRRPRRCPSSGRATRCGSASKSSKASASASRPSKACASRARMPASTRTSPCARFPTARASSASSRSIRRASPRSRWCAAARSGAPSSITCAASPARRRASPSAPATACARKTAPTPKTGGDK